MPALIEKYFRRIMGIANNKGTSFRSRLRTELQNLYQEIYPGTINPCGVALIDFYHGKIMKYYLRATGVPFELRRMLRRLLNGLVDDALTCESPSV